MGHPGVAVDNTDAVYQLDLDPALSADEEAFNQAIVRVGSDPQGRRAAGMANIPVVNGDARIPVLTLHNLGDLFVPFKMEVDYAQRAAANGVSDLVVQRAIRGVRHCDFTAQELITAFDDLVRWVEQGVHPAGDVTLDPAVVAAPEYGCTFTQGSHLLGQPCP